MGSENFCPGPVARARHIPETDGSSNGDQHTNRGPNVCVQHPRVRVGKDAQALRYAQQVLRLAAPPNDQLPPLHDLALNEDDESRRYDVDAELNKQLAAFRHGCGAPV